MDLRDDELECQLAAFRTMPLPALRQEWRNRLGAPPIFRSVALHRYLIAWRIRPLRSATYVR